MASFYNKNNRLKTTSTSYAGRGSELVFFFIFSWIVRTIFYCYFMLAQGGGLGRAQVLKLGLRETESTNCCKNRGRMVWSANSHGCRVSQSPQALRSIKATHFSQGEQHVATTPPPNNPGLASTAYLNYLAISTNLSTPKQVPTYR